MNGFSLHIEHPSYEHNLLDKPSVNDRQSSPSDAAFGSKAMVLLLLFYCLLLLPLVCVSLASEFMQY